MKRTVGHRLQAAACSGCACSAARRAASVAIRCRPLRPLPARVADAAARRVGDRVELRFTIPATNVDNSTPPAITRLDIYAAAGPATARRGPSIPVAVLVAADRDVEADQRVAVSRRVAGPSPPRARP